MEKKVPLLYIWQDYCSVPSILYMKQGTSASQLFIKLWRYLIITTSWSKLLEYIKVEFYEETVCAWAHTRPFVIHPTRAFRRRQWLDERGHIKITTPLPIEVPLWTLFGSPTKKYRAGMALRHVTAVFSFDIYRITYLMRWRYRIRTVYRRFFSKIQTILDRIWKNTERF